MAGHKVYTQAKFCDFLPVSNIECTIPNLSEKVALGAVFVVDFLDANILQWAARGVTVRTRAFLLPASLLLLVTYVRSGSAFEFAE